MSIIMGTVDNLSDVIFSTEEESYEFKIARMKKGKDGVIEPIKIPNEDGFIHAKTKDNHSIAIPLDAQEQPVYTRLNLKTYAYIVSTGNVSEEQLSGFDGIAFTGGSLDKIIWSDRPKISISEEDEVVVKIKRDSFSKSVDIGSETITAELNTSISVDSELEKYSLNSVKELRLLFEEEKPLIDCFEHYNKMRDLISFLTYRKSVGFDEISLLKKDSDNESYTECAKVYIKDNADNLTKRYMFNITFESIKDVFSELLRIIYAEDSEHGYVNLGFIPDDDSNFSYIADDRLRDIVTALECELEHVKDINIEKNEELEKLIELVKDEVKEYRETTTELEEGTYSSIFNSISRWDISLKERINALCKKYEEEITIMNDSDYVINKESIGKVVDCRNALTHGRNTTQTVEIATVAHILVGVIYCCILERIGVDREQIKELCRDTLLR